MLGAIAGDILGSTYEHRPIKNPSHVVLFAPGSRFTDDTVLTVAVADALLNTKPLVEVLKAYHQRYPDAGYGQSFSSWAADPERRHAYGSWGNGSAMRVSPVAWFSSTLDQTLRLAGETAAVTHDHPDAIAGAQAVAGSIWLARTGADRERIRDFAAGFGYDMRRKLDDIRPTYRFDVSCAGSVPEAILAFAESRNWEDAVRKAISLGGDADTQACIAGAIAEAYYGGVPTAIGVKALQLLDSGLVDVTTRFFDTFIVPET